MAGKPACAGAAMGIDRTLIEYTNSAIAAARITRLHRNIMLSPEGIRWQDNSARKTRVSSLGTGDIGRTGCPCECAPI